MIWRYQDTGIRRRFAILPLALRNGPNRAVIWLQWYWARAAGEYREVWLTDPSINNGHGTNE